MAKYNGIIFFCAKGCFIGHEILSNTMSQNEQELKKFIEHYIRFHKNHIIATVQLMTHVDLVGLHWITLFKAHLQFFYSQWS